MGVRLARLFFGFSALYDLVLGVAFLLFWREIYRLGNVTLPGHPIYIQFPSLLMMIVAVMFFRVAQNPRESRELMLYGAALKASFVGLIFWHTFQHTVPPFWFTFGCLDSVLLAGFLAAWRLTPPPSAS